MNRGAKLAFALGAHSPWVVGPLVVVGMLFVFPPGPVASPEQGQAIERAWAAFGIGMVISALGFLATLVAGLAHLFRDATMSSGLRAFWAFGMLLFGAVMLPAYFWARVLPAKSGAEGAP